MNWIIKLVADMLLKGMSPIDDFKTIIGLVIAVAAYVATAMGVEIPALGNDLTSFIGYLLAAFGLGHKGGKAV